MASQKCLHTQERTFALAESVRNVSITKWFYLNHRLSVKRRTLMEHFLSDLGVPYQRVEAREQPAINVSRLRLVKKFAANPMQHIAQISITTTFVDFLNKLVDTPWALGVTVGQFVVWIEDDAKPVSNFHAKLQLALQALPHMWDVASLGWWGEGREADCINRQWYQAHEPCLEWHPNGKPKPIYAGVQALLLGAGAHSAHLRDVYTAVPIQDCDSILCNTSINRFVAADALFEHRPGLSGGSSKLMVNKKAAAMVHVPRRKVQPHSK
eukprot:CAMPEP_0119322010 /NCGR_PEP_ID=MMETSP1333-20130426/57062_1 /TAXON_ID=418940 /ORGANISM="Scyphosphaera apsteinii, Strain RCC1455" /LENGTH=267 /DNA_ID=CAMNT_0007329133 /DNA_START=309 /DNA_END=1112 /DNA_ORIENTATION=-